jgi:hypothetical protein
MTLSGAALQKLKITPLKKSADARNIKIFVFILIINFSF